MTGKIKRLVMDRGFGFIKTATGGEYFFHRTAVVDESGFEGLREGDPVTFEEISSDKGPRAEAVERT